LTIANNYVTFIQPFNEEIMTIQKFKRGDVVTLVTNHYNNDRGDFYKEYDFARIIDIKDNSYVLDLQAEAIVDKRINITVDVNTLQLSKEHHRWYSEYLDDENLHDYIDDLSVYRNVFKKEVLGRKEKLITNVLHDIFKAYIRNRDAETMLDISNAKDEIFLMFGKLYPKQEELEVLERLDHQLHQMIYWNSQKDREDTVQKHYEWILKICSNLDKKDCYNNYNICV
jgi:hypothetical protein